jgi:hypothetical protein
VVTFVVVPPGKLILGGGCELCVFGRYCYPPFARFFCAHHDDGDDDDDDYDEDEYYIELLSVKKWLKLKLKQSSSSI